MPMQEPFIYFFQTELSVHSCISNPKQLTKIGEITGQGMNGLSHIFVADKNPVYLAEMERTDLHNFLQLVSDTRV